MAPSLWTLCVTRLEDDLSPQKFNTWIRPLQAVEGSDALKLLAPNQFVRDFVSRELLADLQRLANNFSASPVNVEIAVGSDQSSQRSNESKPALTKNQRASRSLGFEGRLNQAFTFETHIEGKSNQLARAAAHQVGENPGKAYNPLFLYGGVGLGKTHLMQAAGNLVTTANPKAKVVYVHSERFVADMVKALQHNAINEFKRYYRSLDALLIDDIQFFSGKEHSQEEFFHTFNTLLEGQRQVVITSDRFPKEISGVQERLISRFGSGLTVPIDPPELETRVAILQHKAGVKGVVLPDDVAFFVARQIRSNVRELEGALHRIVASSGFTGRPIDLESTREALRDLLVFQERRVTVQNIQKTVAEYFKMRIADLHSKRRNRQITRPRQMAMALSKELTTVLHAQRKVRELVATDARVREDYQNLQRILGA